MKSLRSLIFGIITLGAAVWIISFLVLATLDFIYVDGKHQIRRLPCAVYSDYEPLKCDEVKGSEESESEGNSSDY